IHFWTSGFTSLPAWVREIGLFTGPAEIPSLYHMQRAAPASTVFYAAELFGRSTETSFPEQPYPNSNLTNHRKRFLCLHPFQSAIRPLPSPIGALLFFWQR